MLSVFIPVFIDNMTVVSFTHRHLGLKGCHVTWVTTICVCVKGYLLTLIKFTMCKFIN